MALETKCFACGGLGKFSTISRWGNFSLCGVCGGDLRKRGILLLEEFQAGDVKQARVLRWRAGEDPKEEVMPWEKFLDFLDKAIFGRKEVP